MNNPTHNHIKIKNKKMNQIMCYNFTNIVVENATEIAYYLNKNAYLGPCIKLTNAPTNAPTYRDFTQDPLYPFYIFLIVLVNLCACWCMLCCKIP